MRVWRWRAPRKRARPFGWCCQGNISPAAARKGAVTGERIELRATPERPAEFVDHLRMKSLIARCRGLGGRLKLGAARKPVIAVVGGTVLLIGIALIVLPGPAFIVIPLGLAILATEFLWAQRWLKKVRSLLPTRTKPRPTTRPP